MLKFPLRLPLCPECGARFLYSQVKKDKNKKMIVCPNCKHQFKVSYKRGAAILIIFAVIVLICINDLILTTAPFMNVIGLCAVTAIGICITYFFIPYTVRFKK